MVRRKGGYDGTTRSSLVALGSSPPERSLLLCRPRSFAVPPSFSDSPRSDSSTTVVVLVDIISGTRRMQVFDLHHDDFDDVSTTPSANGTFDVAFRKVNKNSTFFLIWKIENMNIIALPKDQYGTFYDTDSYVIYAASQYGQSCGVDTVTREIKNGVMEYHIHFWLGSSTNPDKSGVAAYKTVELDNFLNGLSTQHRETEGNESARFLNYFKNGIRVLRPDTSQNKVKLNRIKGRRIPVIKEMPEVSWNQFNSSGVFLIHTTKCIFVWIGRATNAAEKLQAIKFAVNMQEMDKIPGLYFVDDGYEKTLPENVRKEFNKYLPLEKRVILPENHHEDQNGNCQSPSVKLYKCSDNNGKYRVVEIKNGPFTQSDLNSDDVFIIDQDVKGIWVWVGRRANDKERSEALRNARGFVKKKKYPNNTKVTRVIDGQEPLEFMAMFSYWKDEVKVTKPTILISKYDAITMEERPGLAAETQLIDDGSGTLTIWRIKQSSIVEIPKERHGIFFSGDCYIVLYTYQTLIEQRHLLYCWLGLHANQEEINSTTVKMTEIEEELGDIGFHARLIQGKETAHFLQLFKGKLIAFKGKGTDFDPSGKNLKNPTQYLVQVFGSTTYSSKAAQVSVKASAFDSNFCFVLRRSKKSFIWCGTYSTGDQREMAKGFAGKDFELVLEGKEREDFFNFLGGKAPYSTKMSKVDGDPKPARLFYCESNGHFKAEEIVFFSQKDLTPESVMLLDANNFLFIWIGRLSSKEEQRLSVKMAIEYLQTDPSGRDMNIAVIHVKQDKEPPTFVGYFPNWDKTLWKDYKTFSKLRHEIEMKTNCNSGSESNGFPRDDPSRNDFDQFDKYPLAILKEPNDKLPSRVNHLNKELHLTHDDFVTIFKLSYSEFEKLPRWKQQEMKKRVGLF